MLSSKKAAKKCVVCGAGIAERMPAGDLCAECFRQCVALSGLLRYLQNTSIENLNAIQDVAIHGEAMPINKAPRPTNPVTQEKPIVYSYKIVRKKTGESYILFDQICKIGKSAEMADIVITDNGTLSRCHAMLEKTAEGVLLSDCSSKNGTRFGGEKLEPGKKVLLKSGDSFMLSNELWTFIRE